MAPWRIEPIHCESSSSPSSLSSPSSSSTSSNLNTTRVEIPSAASAISHAIPGSTKGNDISHWKKSFDKNCKTAEDGTKYLDEDAFVTAIAPGEYHKITKRQYANLFRVADSKKRGKVSWEDFVTFESLLLRSDADFEVAFRVFDIDGNGEISFDEFKRVFSENLGSKAIPFDFDANWVKLYLGNRKGGHQLGYNEFTQLMKGLQGERLRQAFRYFDPKETGYIRPEDFVRIFRELAEHKLSDSVLDRLPTIVSITPGGRISYSDCIAFHNVLREMDLIERVIGDACRKSSDGRISQSDFMETAARNTRYGMFTPLEVAIIFTLAGIRTDKTRLAQRDFAQLLDPKWNIRVDVAANEITPQTSPLTTLLKSIYNFGLGGIAGAIGATAVYPIDLVKTRMQNQRSKVVGELLYRNSMDCVRKVYKNEGFLGFYRGLPPQLVGVAPEKAIKLTVNDLIRGKTKDPETGRIHVGWEVFAGGMAGGSQVVFTNPLEIVKIRLQMQGEAIKASGGQGVPRGAGHIIKQLGLVGLYKGAAACLTRDVPFSAIYFTAYAHLKKDYFDEGKNGKKLSFVETLTAAGIAGMPAAYLTTPADVVKTRLQSEARKGEKPYKGLMDAFRTIRREEGVGALFKGGPARVLRSSPQFGVTLVTYETLQTILPYPFDKEEKAPKKAEDEMITRVRARNALKLLLDVYTDFGDVKSGGSSSS